MCTKKLKVVSPADMSPKTKKCNTFNTKAKIPVKTPLKALFFSFLTNDRNTLTRFILPWKNNVYLAQDGGNDEHA